MPVKPRGALLFLPLLTLIALPAISAADTPTNIKETYGKVPLQFEENRAQADKAVRFVAHGLAYSLYLTPEDAVLVLAKPSEKANDEPSEAVALRMSVVGARSMAAVAGVDELPGKANYFVGNDPSQWRTNVPTYAKVRYSGVYPGIDLVYYGQQRQLEYDFVVAPGVDPAEIALAFDGANDLEIDAQGDLVLHTAAGDVRQHKPVVYQDTDGLRHEIEGRYVRKDETRVGFDVAEYDHSRPLVIDPVLSYATYLGGNERETNPAIALDTDGNVYVTGITWSGNFPTTSGALGTPAGTGSHVIFVTKLNSTGSAAVYSAYFGGIPNPSAADIPSGIALDSDRNVYVTGGTNSLTFPTTAGALRRSLPGSNGLVGPPDAFVTKLNATGSALVYSTYLGGSSNDIGDAIAVDADRNAYVVGSTNSSDFPTTAGAFQSSVLNPRAAFVAKLDASGGALVYSTFLGGGVDANPAAIAVDAMGQAYVVNNTSARDFPTTPGAFQTVLRGTVDAVVTKLNDTGSALVYSTFLGGGKSSEGDGLTRGNAIAIDASGHAYVTGYTDTSDFPVTPGAFQSQRAGLSEVFVTKLDPSGSALGYSTYLGGANDDFGTAIAVDVDGNAFVTGSTFSTDFPHTLDACEIALRGAVDAFVAMLAPDGAALVYSTYIGGSEEDRGEAIAVDDGGNAYVAGTTGLFSPSSGTGCEPCGGCAQCTNDFPTTPRSFQPRYGGGENDAFVVKIAEPVLPLPSPATSAATSSSSPLVPAAAGNVGESGQSAASGGGGAFDWLTLSALLAALGLARRRRAQR